jgi:phosphatidylglycerol---prolipoprotein diacylglyceryl transferase
VHPRLFQFGHIAIPTYGALTALALIAALAAAVHFARHLALDPNKIWTFSLTAILTTLIGARLLLVSAHFSGFRQHPFWILGLAGGATGSHDFWIVPVSVSLGIAAGALYALAEGLPLLRIADCLAPAITLAFAINRIGAFIAGLDFGTPAALPWSVTYTSRIAALWYHTPLSVPMHPVQLYDAAIALFVFVLLTWVPSRRHQGKQDGELAGAALFIFGLANSFLSLYRPDLTRPAFSLALSIAAILGGAALWLDRSSKPRTAILQNDDSPAS